MHSTKNLKEPNKTSGVKRKKNDHGRREWSCLWWCWLRQRERTLWTLPGAELPSCVSALDPRTASLFLRSIFSPFYSPPLMPVHKTTQTRALYNTLSLLVSVSLWFWSFASVSLSKILLVLRFAFSLYNLYLFFIFFLFRSWSRRLLFLFGEIWRYLDGKVGSSENLI